MFFFVRLSLRRLLFAGNSKKTETKDDTLDPTYGEVSDLPNAHTLTGLGMLQ